MQDDPIYRLGRAIRSVRRYHDLTQEQLADRSGVDVKHLGEIERGKKNIQWLTLVRLARAMGVPISEIVGRYEEGPPKRPRGSPRRA